MSFLGDTADTRGQDRREAGWRADRVLALRASSVETWTTRNLEPVDCEEVTGSVWLAGSDPQLEARGPLDVAVDEYNELHVSVAVGSPIASQFLRVYYSCDAAGDFNDEECLCHALQADGQMHVYRLKLSNVGGSQIRRLRVDPFDYAPGSEPYRFILGDIAFAHVEGDKTGVEKETEPSEAPVVIQAHHVSKSYRPQSRQISLRQEAAAWIGRFLRRHRGDDDDVFWALQDVSFEVRAGEAVAILGNNGSGKTTLLRILSRITSPQSGWVRVHGRFAALLGLNAGFNYEQTGRENIYLNAAILGLHPKVTAQRIDSIIEFSELGQFVDVPVKRYSSGMVARLGFSIAAHMSPDLVFLDEVLAVGDLGFQEKCIGRLHAMKNEGKTLLFVAHSPALLRQLCDRGLWLNHGRLLMDGPIRDVLEAYEAHENVTEAPL